MTQERPFDIPQGYLDIVGLTEETLARFKAENAQELQELYKQAKLIGKQGYAAADNNEPLTVLFIPNPSGPLGEIQKEPIVDIVSDPSELPDILFSTMLKGSHNQERARETAMYLKDMIEGVGEAALTTRDWQTAVNAYDIISEGGIETSEEFKRQIARFSLERKNYVARREIAEAIQRRIQAREPNVSS